MRISTFVTILLFVGVVFFVMAMMTQEANDKYDTGINTSNWEDKYDYKTEVNESVNPLIQSIDDITNEEKGWLEKVGSGFTGIISAVTLLPALVWKSFTTGGSLLTGVFSSFGVPAYILSVFIIALTIWGVFQLIQFFQRWQT